MIAQSIREKSLKGTRLLGFALIIVALALLLVPPMIASAADIYITNTNDSGAGSLRQAVIDAGPGDTIYFDTNNIAPGSTIFLTSGEIVINKNLNIIGPYSASELTISGNNNSRVFNTKKPAFPDEGPPPDVLIENLRIADGKSPDSTTPNGGGILNRGKLTLRYCIIEDNHSTDRLGKYNQGASGGGICNHSLYGDWPDLSGIMDIQNCIIRFNTTGDGGSRGGDGAGIYNDQGKVKIINSTINDNVCGGNIDDPDGGPYKGGGNGGGICTELGELTLTNCTVSHNFAGDAYFSDYGTPAPDIRSLDGGIGGGIASLGSSVVLNNCTIVYNEAGTAWDGGDYLPDEQDGAGGGIFDVSIESVHARNCIIAHNIAPFGWGNDILTRDPVENFEFGRFYSHRCNIITDPDGWYPASSGSDTTGDQIGVGPILGDLLDNGGFSPTHALLEGSPAIDGVLDGYCLTIPNGASEAVSEDQRGIARPQDGDNDGQALCDIGAYEYEYVPPPSPPPVPPPPAPPVAVGGEVFPVNKVTLLVPWIVLAVVMIAGGVFLIRRSAQLESIK